MLNEGVAKPGGGDVFSESSIFTRLCNQYTRVRGARRKREEKIDAADITAEVRDNKRKKKKTWLEELTPFNPPRLNRFFSIPSFPSKKNERRRRRRSLRGSERMNV